MKLHLKSAAVAAMELTAVLAIVGCGGGTAAVATDSTTATASTSASTANAESLATTEATTLIDQTAQAQTDAQALRRSRSVTKSTSTTGTSTATTTVATTTTSASAPAVKLSWVSPIANATVSGLVSLQLKGQAFRNVEIFSGTTRVATGTVSSDLSTATATVDTTKFADGVLSLTAHGWDSAAGTAYTSDADAGALSVVVKNAVPAPVATTPVATTPTAAPTPVKLTWVSPVANTKVSGMLPVKLTGQGFKNVEIFSGSTVVAAATVAGDQTSATAVIDTTKLANGAVTLTAHAWDSVAGAAFTSDADAGALPITVSNTVAATPATTTASTNGPLIGVNIHWGGGNATDRQKIADVMKSRNLTTARMDFGLGGDLAGFRDQVTRLIAAGIKAEASLQNSYQWDHSCSQNFSAVEQDSYNQTVTMVQQIGDLVQDFELLNEVVLRPELAAQVTPFQATPASGYAGKSCYTTIAAVLRGMSRAIIDQRNATGRPLRVIMGTVVNDFGLLDFVQQQGVVFDIISYHVYPSANSPTIASDPWYGPGGPLAQLAKFNKPVRINEFNCGEIYSASYENAVGGAVTNTCLTGIQKHMSSLLAQKLINLESIHAYEITDRPGQAGSEARFGLMYTLDNPKLHLALYSAFSGGSVSAAERQQLTTLGVSGK